MRTLSAWRHEAQPLFNECGVEVPEALAHLQQLAEDLQRLPQLHGDERLDALSWLRGEYLEAYRAYLALFREIQGLYEQLAVSVTPALLENLSLLDQLKTGCGGLRKLGIGQETDLSAVFRLVQKINGLEGKLQEVGEPLAELSFSLGPAFQNVLAMHEQGLRELRQLVELTVALEPSFWKIRHERFDEEELDEALPQLQARITVLREQRDSLSSAFHVDRLPPVSKLEEIQARVANSGLLRWFKRDWRAARRHLLALSAKPRRGLKPLLPVLDEWVNFAKNMEAFGNDQKFHRLLGEHFKGLETAVEELHKLRSWYRQIRQCYGVGFGSKVRLGQALIDMPVDVVTGVRSLAAKRLSWIIEALEELDRLKTVLPKVKELQQGNTPLLGTPGILPKLKAYIVRSLTPCRQYLIGPDLTLGALERLSSDLIRLRDLTAQWEASDIDAKWFGGTLGLTIGRGHDNEAALTAAEHTESLASVLGREVKAPALKEAIYNRPERRPLEELAACGQQLANVWSEHRTTLQQFSDLTLLDFSTWVRKSGDLLGKLEERNDKALSNPEWLANWLVYARVKQRVVEAGFGRLAQAVEQGMLAPTDVESGYHLAVYDLLSREILREIPSLARFSGNEQETVQKQFRDYDEKLKDLHRERIAWRTAQNTIPAGSSGGKISDYTEHALLRHECSKKKKHIPIRKLVKRAGQALAALKPCFMMGPMSLAQYLSPGALEFDIVVMDEASQIKPEDALGAVARARQLVVVGDPRQLPPTSFFERVIDEDEDDLTALEESESILDAVLPLFKARRLRWHYRSQHENLIAFSNQFFYDGKLILFPSPHNDADEYGVKFTRVHRGRFITRRNIEEARVIAEAVRMHLLEQPGESLGVVAMSAEQRDAIECAIEDLAKENEHLFQPALEQDLGKIEPVFIKNLENVQGDERDVMFISMTYGPQEVGGLVMQRFGPINSDTGWRRLNVLFTRARKRMHVFSSMGSGDIVLSESSKRGVRALKDFLAYAETGILHSGGQPSNRPPDSDFEIAVAEALGNVGFECVCQVGAAGFFIDIAVRDPGNPGRYLMGVECDGASYHSAKSVRDRDRLRQAILERLGWRIRRIWSTDWYQNPQAQLQPIIRELNALKTENPAVPALEPEAKEIDAIVAKLEKEEQALGSTAGAGTLRERLVQFDQDVIRKACPNTSERKQLLRPPMLEALIDHRPASKSEFLERIPPYLRQATSAEEEKYLARVLEIIDNAGEGAH